jgi:hypothetical protein
MATGAVPLVLPQETLAQLRFILGRLFEEGNHWVRSIDLQDWRRSRYIAARARRSTGSGPSILQVVDNIEPVLGYLSKEASNLTGGMHSYVIVKGDSGCLAENGIALVRPVLKTNCSGELTLNFHVWFHCMPSGRADDHLVMGWRLEHPEGSNTSHDFFHAQPMRKFGLDESVHGMHNRFPESFPTIPLPAANVVELCLTAVLVACGKEALRTFVRTSANAEVRAAARGFWTKLFGITNHTVESAVSSG